MSTPQRSHVVANDAALFRRGGISDMETAKVTSQAITEVISDENFDEVVVQDPQLVVACVSTAWSGSAEIVRCSLCHLAEVFEGAATFGTVDADRNRQLVDRLGLVSFPALVFLKSGAVVDLVVGMTSRTEPENKVRALL